jgi:hypothetical protein
MIMVDLEVVGDIRHVGVGSVSVGHLSDPS